MGMLVKAMRAVFVELLGVILVLWLLFGGVTWTLESAGVRRAAAAEAGLLAKLTQSVKSRFAGRREAASPTSDEVSARLQHYSRVYGRAATGYFGQVTNDLTHELNLSEEL